MRILCLSLFAGCMLALPALAQPVDRLDYIELNPPQSTSNPNAILVTEFFSYQCPHCFALEPVLAAWVDDLPDGVVFERVPISFGYRQWGPIAQAYHAFEAIGQLDAVHAGLFRAIHVEGQRLDSKEAIVEWARGRGIDADAFAEAYDSFGVSLSARRGDQRAKSHRVDSVPALAIDGRYRATIGNNGTVENFERQLAAVIDLIEEIARDRQ